MTEHIETPVKLTGIARAVEAAGGQSALARLLDVSQQAVQQWLLAGYAPTSRVATISIATGVAAVDLLDPRIIEVLETDPVHGPDGGANIGKPMVESNQQVTDGSAVEA